ncbi:hypothetical protein [Arthrobacter bambusae]|uniref:hypothetical protein n=1 Tax=Arthrobacter bambusae TaxID=1338426 RepID=UPI0027813363|nr:hypothetical protein [Arthrobacter bambusae]MDQ0030015.1 hypothetical protein [Arthrobacter bambusae]MDQ0097467.1 hypothetical protein [Arthrobacter bambusae]
MSEKSASRGEQGIDRLLAEAGLDEAYEIRAELLELRALAGTRPQPSAAVQALMAPARVAMAPTVETDTAESPAEPFDELAARRRRKRRAGIATLAVAASLAAGATAAAASNGGIPGTIEHLGAAVGSVVSKFAPGSGGNAPQQQGTLPTPDRLPSHDAGLPVQPTPAHTSPDAAVNGEPSTPRATPGPDSAGSQADPSKGLPDIAKGKPAPVTIPTPTIPSPGITLPQSVPSDLLPGSPVKP